MSGLNKRRALAQLEQARLHLERAEWAQAEALAREVLDAGFDELLAFAVRADALRQLNRAGEAVAVVERGLKVLPNDPHLESRMGSLLLDVDDAKRAAEYFARARKKLPRDAQILTGHAAALLSLGEAEEAEPLLTRALLLGGGEDTRLVLALTKFRRGQHAEADRLAAQLEAAPENPPTLVAQARALRAELAVRRGEAKTAFAIWRELEAAGQVNLHQLSHLAYAAELAGERAAADAAIARRQAQDPTASDWLMFAQIQNHRGDFRSALASLGHAESLPAPDDESGWKYELLAVRGRALRLAGERVEAKRVLEAALALPEGALPNVGAGPNVDLGHLAAEEGDFETAQARFEAALKLDPDEPEAKRALELTSRRLHWREAVESSAGEKIEAARAEADAMRRRYLMRETEVDRLKREVRRLTAEREHAAAATEAAKREASERVKAELEAREHDIDTKAAESLQVLDGARCPPRLEQLLRVAERTYQHALYMELPAAAVSVMFAGAFERSLVELLVTPFGPWLDARGLRERFLSDGVAEKRGSRVEYFDRFFEAFDTSFESRPPSLGEVSRVLDKRDERYLSIFSDYLRDAFSLPSEFWGALATFVTWSKETLRDPVAHGHLELEWDVFKQFRGQLLFEFAGEKPGALPRLLKARR